MAFNPVDYTIQTDESTWIEVRHNLCGEIANQSKGRMSLATALIMIEGHVCPKSEE